MRDGEGEQCSQVTWTDSKVADALLHLRDTLQDVRDVTCAGSEPHLRDQKRRERISAMEATETMITACALNGGSDASTRPSFRELVPSCFKGPVLRQLSDSRAAVVFTAVRLITSFFTYTSCAILLEQCSNSFMAPLLRVTASSNSRVRQAASAALAAIVSATFGSEAFGEVIKAACSSTHRSVRCHAFNTILLAMQHVKGTCQNRILSKYMKSLSGVVRRGLLDSSSDVRRVAVVCFWGLHLLDSSAAEEMLGTMQLSTRTHVIAQRREALEVVGVVAPSVRDASLCCEPAQPCGGDANRPPDVMSSKQDIEEEVSAVKARDARCLALRSTHRHPLSRHVDPFASFLREFASTTPRHTARYHPPPPPPRQQMRETSAIAGPYAALAEATPHHDPIDWKKVLSQLNSSSWHVCETGLRHLQTEQQWECCVASGCGKEAFHLVIRSINDSNRRIDVHALQALRYLISFVQRSDETSAVMRSVVQEALSYLFAALMQSSARQRAPPSRKDLWLEVLISLVALFSPSQVLFSAITSLKDEMSWKACSMAPVKARLLELVQYIVEEHHNLLDAEEPTWMSRRVLPGLLSVVPSATGVPYSQKAMLEWALTNAIISAYNAAGTSFLRSYFGLTPEQRSDLCGCMERWHPEFRQWLLECSEISCKKADRRFAMEFESSLGVLAGLRRYRSQNGLSRSGLPKKDVETRAEVKPAGPLRQIPVNEWKNAGKKAQRTKTAPSDYVSFSCAARVSDRPLFSTPLSPQYATDALLAPSASLQMQSKRRQKVTDAAVEALEDFWSTVPTDGSGGGIAAALVSALVRHRSLAERDKCRLLGNVESCVKLDADSWSDESLFLRLFRGLEKLSSADVEPHHSVRRRAFSVLRTLLVSSPLQSFLPMICEQVLLACRGGMDDAFAEVQQEAITCVHLLLHSCSIPYDTALNGLAASLERWLQPPLCLFCTAGWMELLHCVGRFFERSIWNVAAASPPDRRGAVTRRVVHRLLRLLSRLMDHSVSKVRDLAVTVVAVMRWTVEDCSAMTDEILSPSQKNLVLLSQGKLLN